VTDKDRVRGCGSTKHITPESGAATLNAVLVYAAVRRLSASRALRIIRSAVDSRIASVMVFRPAARAAFSARSSVW
jgi:hypothetical protein